MPASFFRRVVLASGRITRSLVFWSAVSASAIAQEAPRCREGKPPTGDLGIGGFQCVAAGCRVNGLVNGRYEHSFSAEPYVWDIDPRGPSRDHLEEGDRIVAIDELLITTPAGGVRMANLSPGERISLTIRRNDRVFTVTLTAVLGCNMPYIRVTPDRRRYPPPEDWRPAGEEGAD